MQEPDFRNRYTAGNADLPRPRQDMPDYPPVHPDASMQELPALRRRQPGNSGDYDNNSVHYYDEDNYDEDKDEDEDENEEYDNQHYQTESGYGAYEAYDMPGRHAMAVRESGKSGKSGRSGQSGRKQRTAKPVQQNRKKQSAPPAASRKSGSTSHAASHGGGFLQRLMRKFVILVCILFAIYSAVALLLISKLEHLPRGERQVTSGTLEAGYVQNILLIGTDARDITTERGRSDTMLLLSLNSRSQKIYLTSFMRDAYVEIPGYGNHKLNAAYSYGGAELLMDTLEQNYQIRIDDYCCVSFMGFAGIIDALGGVKIAVSDAEAGAINEILQSEVNELAGDDPMADFLEKGGEFILNGKQALSYARIRYVGNADFERTSRQREVMTQLFQNVKTRMVTAVPELVSSALPHVGANMSTAQLYFLSLRVPFAVTYDIEQIQIPADGTYSYADIDGQSVLQVDFAANQQILQDSIFSVPDTEMTEDAYPAE